jgi:urease accessory protein
VIAATHVEVGLDDRGRTAVRRMRCEAPLLVRVADDAGPGIVLLLVNGAAGPLGGDRLRFELTVDDGCVVEVRSVAASMAQPGATGDASTLEVDLRVGVGATLQWSPEPMVSVVGSDHRTVVRLRAAPDARVTVRESVSLGRHREPPGRSALRQRVEVGGVVVLDHETVFGTGALAGPGAQGNARSITSTVVLGVELPAVSSQVTSACVHSTVHLSPTCALTTTAH